MEKPQPFQPGDFVMTSSFGGPEVMETVKSRIGNYAILSGGVKFHILDDCRRSQGIWYHKPSETTIKLIGT
jgi:hypothetical protein